MARDETALFLRRFQDRMPPGKLEEGRARAKSEQKHGIYDAEIDEVLYECPPETLWAWRPAGEDPGGVDLWNVMGTTGAGRVVFIVGRMGDDGLFRLVSPRSVVPPTGGDRKLLRDYRRLIRSRPGAEEEGEQ